MLGSSDTYGMMVLFGMFLFPLLVIVKMLYRDAQERSMEVLERIEVESLPKYTSQVAFDEIVVEIDVPPPVYVQ